MKVNKENILKWTKALRSGNYKQGFGRLQKGNTFCCLGVACKIFIPKEYQVSKNNNLFGGTLSSQPNSPKWLREIITEFSRKHDCSLIALNDVNKLTFDEI